MDTVLEWSDCSKKKKRVCFFIGNMSHSGGTERVLSVIVNGLYERGFSVFIMSLWGEGKSFFDIYEGIKLYWIEQEFKGTGITGIIGRLHYLNRILQKEKAEVLVDVDIILGCYSLFLKRRMKGLRWVSWEHFNYYYHFSKNHYLRKIIRRLVCRYADELVVLTQEDKGYYQKNLKLKCGITQIYNPVPYMLYERETKGVDFAECKRQPMIFAAGRLTRAKGFDLLIQSWKRLEHDYPKWKVIIAGEGEERISLEKAIKKAGLKHIRLIGNVPDIERYYKEAAFFVLPSRDEGFVMVLLEAMFFSNPVVSYNCKTGPKEIVADGKNGFLIEPGEIEKFAEKMEVFMRDAELRRKMGIAGRESASRFSREKVLENWERVLRK